MKSTLFHLKPGLIIEKKDDAVMIFDADTSKLHTLNESASFMFGLIKARKNEEFIVEKTMKKYEIDQKIVTKDLHLLIHKLQKNSILI